MNRLFQPSRTLAGRLLDGESPRRGQIWLAFTLLAVYSILDRVITADPSDGAGGGFPMSTVLFALTVGVLVQILLVGGLWLHLGAKIMGAKGSFELTLQAAAAALLVPALIGLAPGLASAVLWSRGPSAWAAVPLVLSMIYGAICVWAMGRAANAVRHVHGLSLGRGVFVFLWFPTLVLCGWGVLYLTKPELFQSVG